MKRSALDIIERVTIKATNEKQHVAKLSGGNQQKVAIGKWLVSDAEIFIFDEPTKGVVSGQRRKSTT